MERFEELEAAYPEAAPFIRQAVAEHGEDWVIENYHPRVAQLGLVMAVPDIEELPFFDPERHDAPSAAEEREIAAFYGEYLSNLRSGTKPGEREDADDGDAAE